MKVALIVFFLGVVSALPKTAYEICTSAKCKLPKCQCASTNPPIAGKIPQLVVLSFDDSATKMLRDVMMDSFLYQIKNHDGCPISGTFFVPHDYTDYTVCNELYNKGFEIASHSITKTPSVDYWKNATRELLKEEMGGQRDIISKFANIPKEAITGGRIPMLELNRYALVSENDAQLHYDSSWPTLAKYFPYTMDYDTEQHCTVEGCHDIPIPGFWVSPIIDWIDQDGVACNSILACAPRGTADVKSEWMKNNFWKHYNTSRVPFSIRVGLGWYGSDPTNKEAFQSFINFLVSHEDVYIISQKQLIQWSQYPTLKYNSCRNVDQVSCKAKVCVLEHDTQTRYMSSCVACPKNYPWLGNPLGN